MSKDIKTLIGLRIKALRKEKGLTQEQLAFASNLDRTYINSVENGKRNIAIVNIQKITIAFGVSLADFFEYID